MNEHKFKCVTYSNRSPFFTYRSGSGFLIIEDDKITFKGMLITISVLKEHTCIRIVNSEKIRIFNKKYKFMYLYSKSLTDIINNLKIEGYDIINKENITIKRGIFQQDFSKILFGVIYVVIFLFILYIFLHKYEII